MGVALSYDAVGAPAETGAPDAAGHFVSWDLLAEHMVDEARTGADLTALHAK